jgi:hypothetical protein
MFHNTGITAETSAAPLVVKGAQPVWLTLNDARERAFTGEIVFETDPEVFVYLDHGIVYYAERVSDASLGSRLLDAGVVDKAQLDRGTVRVGDIEHLGRLFDRDPSVDRDAVIVVAEAATAELIADMANRVTATARVTAYRHHPSGVHRWFVAPVDPVAVQRPVGAVAQLDSTVVDQLPGLPFADGDELTIEWDDEFDGEFDGECDDEFDGDRAEFDGEFDLSLLEVPERPVDELEILHDGLDADVFGLSFDHAELVDEDDADVSLVFDELFDVEPREADVDELVPALDEVVETVETVESPADEISPDVDVFAEVQEAAEAGVAAVEVAAPEVAEPEVAEVEVTAVEVASVGVADVIAGADDATVGSSEDLGFSVVWPDDDLEEPADGGPEFVMPPLELGQEPEQDGGEVPDDVAEAVRRAIAAIESASVAATPAAEVTGQLPQVDDFAIEFTDPAGTPSHDAPRATGAAASPFGTFAPPAMATRAEVLYGQMTDDGRIIEEQVVAPADGDNDRSSALRRLIGSLRRKER